MYFSMMIAIRLDAGDEAVRMGRRWLQRIPRAIAPRYWATLDAALPLDPESLDVYGPEDVQTPSGRPRAALMTHKQGRYPRTTVFSPRKLENAVRALEDFPLATVLSLDELDTEDAILEPGNLTIGIHRKDEDPSAFSFTLSGDGAARGGIMDSGEVVFSAATEEVREICREVNVDFAVVGDPGMALWSTSLEESLGYYGLDLNPHEVLRGYGWVTVISGELATRLGGADAMRSGEAFAVVEELPHGGLWLQATERYENYDEDAVWRVFRAFVPVLPDEKPGNFELGRVPWYIVPESPVDYR